MPNYRQLAYQCFGATINYADCCRWFTKQRGENPYFLRLNAASAQMTMRRLDQSFANFFRRVAMPATKPGYPEFKSRGCFNSFTFRSCDGGARLIDKKLYVQHVGTIRIKLHRPVEGTIKTITIKHEAGKWYVIFACEVPAAVTCENTLPPLAIDLGLTRFITDSTNKTEPNPRFYKKALPELRLASRNVSRKKKGGKNRRKAVSLLQKAHARVKNARREHHIQVARRLVRRSSKIVVERLNIKGMVKNRRLARAISDAGWYSFVNILKHQANKAGAQVVEVDPRGTSQECSRCHQVVPKELHERWHECPHCGLSIDRDHNAALNILARGLDGITPAGGNVRLKPKRSPRKPRVKPRK